MPPIGRTPDALCLEPFQKVAKGEIRPIGQSALGPKASDQVAVGSSVDVSIFTPGPIVDDRLTF